MFYKTNFLRNETESFQDSVFIIKGHFSRNKDSLTSVDHKSLQLAPLANPGDFRSWESPQTLPALFIGPFEHVEWFRNLKFAVKKITNIQSTVLNTSEVTAAIYLAFK